MRRGCSPGIVREADNLVKMSQPDKGAGQLGITKKKCIKEYCPSWHQSWGFKRFRNLDVNTHNSYQGKGNRPFEKNVMWSG